MKNLILFLFIGLCLHGFSQNLYVNPAGGDNHATVVGKTDSKVWYAGDWEASIRALSRDAIQKHRVDTISSTKIFTVSPWVPAGTTDLDPINFKQFLDFKNTAVIRDVKNQVYLVNEDTTSTPFVVSRHYSSKEIQNQEIDIKSTLAHFGGGDWGESTKYGISFGFKNPSYFSKYPALWIGADTKSTYGRTNSDFIVATRSSIDDVAPTIKFRVTTDGYIKAWVGYVPKTKDDIVNKAYLDYRIPEPPAKGTYVLTSVDGIVNWVVK